MKIPFCLFTKINNRKSARLLVLIFLILSSCSLIYFEAPQPPDTDNIPAIPDNLQGSFVYNHTSDTMLIINRNTITLIQEGDDLIFTISDSVLLRYSKPYYFLNVKEPGKDLWNVFFARQKSRNALILYSIPANYHTIERLKKITEIKTDSTLEGKSVNYYLNPDKGEMNRIVNSGNLREIEKLRKK